MTFENILMAMIFWRLLSGFLRTVYRQRWPASVEEVFRLLCCCLEIDFIISEPLFVQLSSFGDSRIDA